jgi:asparagine N-glycosylation enzyme membrane subunit Stt3
LFLICSNFLDLGKYFYNYYLSEVFIIQFIVFVQLGLGKSCCIMRNYWSRRIQERSGLWIQGMFSILVRFAKHRDNFALLASFWFVFVSSFLCSWTSFSIYLGVLVGFLLLPQAVDFVAFEEVIKLERIPKRIYRSKNNITLLKNTRAWIACANYSCRLHICYILV